MARYLGGRDQIGVHYRTLAYRKGRQCGALEAKHEVEKQMIMEDLGMVRDERVRAILAYLVEKTTMHT